jgi:hypothetical protein
MGDNTGADGEQHCPARVSSGALAWVWLAFEWCVLLLLDPPSVEQALPWMVYLGAPAFVLLFTLSHAQKRGPQSERIYLCASLIFPRRRALHGGVWPLLSASLSLCAAAAASTFSLIIIFIMQLYVGWCRQHPLRSGLWVNYVIICWLLLVWKVRLYLMVYATKAQLLSCCAGGGATLAARPAACASFASTWP